MLDGRLDGSQLRQCFGELRRVAVVPLDRLLRTAARRATTIRTSSRRGTSSRRWRRSVRGSAIATVSVDPSSSSGTSRCRLASACGTTSSAARGDLGLRTDRRPPARIRARARTPGRPRRRGRAATARRRARPAARAAPVSARELLGGEHTSPPQDLSESRRHHACGRDADRTASADARQREPRTTQRQHHGGERRTPARPPLERERALVQQHRGAVERGTPGLRGGDQERRRGRTVDQVDEEAVARRGLEPDRERLAARGRPASC